MTRDTAGGPHGVEAVLDKDLTAALLVRDIGADALVLPERVTIQRSGPSTAC